MFKALKEALVKSGLPEVKKDTKTKEQRVIGPLNAKEKKDIELCGHGNNPKLCEACFNGV